MFVQVWEVVPYTAPAVGGGGPDEACADGVLADVLDGGGEVGVAVDDARGEAVAEEVAGSSMTLVQALGVDAVEPAEAVGELPAGTREDEVVVARHQAERDHVPPLLACDVREEGEEVAPVVVVPEDRAAVDAFDRDVVDAVGQVAARDARHASTLGVRRVARHVLGTLRHALGSLAMAARDESQGQSLVFARRARARR